MESAVRPRILDRLSSLSDGLRCRILLILERQELTVSELCAVLQLPQSTVSRHLKTLTDSGWIVSRPDGTRRLYRMPAGGDRDAQGHKLWQVAREEMASTSGADQDVRRLQSVLDERRSRSREFFAGAGGRWDRLRDELFGPRFYLGALMGLLADDWIVGDLGCGSGSISEALAPFVRRVVAVDDSEAMLDAARKRLGRLDNVDLRRGELEALPIEDGQLDAATAVLVLHHIPDPAAALGEVARVLRPGGKLLIVDMLPHDRQEYRQEMGHVWLGFSEQEVDRLLASAGFARARFLPLRPAASAKGPGLFVATAARPGVGPPPKAVPDPPTAETAHD